VLGFDPVPYHGDGQEAQAGIPARCKMPTPFPESVPLNQPIGSAYTFPTGFSLFTQQNTEIGAGRE
jgi:hypothetical protein